MYSISSFQLLLMSKPAAESYLKKGSLFSFLKDVCVFFFVEFQLSFVCLLDALAPGPQCAALRVSRKMLIYNTCRREAFKS